MDAKTAYIEPGSLWEDSYDESDNANLGDDLLSGTLFFSLTLVCRVIAAWIEDCNTKGPHSRTAYEAPAAYAEQLIATGWHATPLRGLACQPVAQPSQPGIQRAETLIGSG